MSLNELFTEKVQICRIFTRILHNMKDHWYPRYLPEIDVTDNFLKSKDDGQTGRIF